MTTLFHATTMRAAQLIADGDGLDPGMSERFEHIFVFDSMDSALAFVNAYPGNFSDTGPVILEIDGDGLNLEPDPQRPPLPGAWRTDELADLARIRGEYAVITGGSTVKLGPFVDWQPELAD